MTRGLWHDTRLVGAEHWHYCDDAELMDIPPQLPQCVCFIEAGWGDDVDPIGTGFFVGVPATRHLYLVTAKHVLEPAPNDDGTPYAAPYDTIRFRLNGRTGGHQFIGTNIDAWHRHPTADVAVYLLDPEPPAMFYTYRALDLPSVIAAGENAPLIMAKELLVMGLFVHHPGETRMVPVSRLGSVAALPVDPLPDDYTEGHGMFLAELRSIGGVSGSPVFLEQPAVFTDDRGNTYMVNPAMAGEARGYRFVGMVQSVWDEDGRSSGAKDFRRVREPLNVGMAAIEPAVRIREAIGQKELDA